MSRREDIDTAIWEDEDFDALSDDAAFLYLWSFTNERCGMAGVYQVKGRHICEGRMTPARRTAALEELREAQFVYYQDGWLWVRSRVKHLRTRGEKMAASIIKDLKKVPIDHPFYDAFLSEYLKNTWVSNWLSEADFDTPSIPHRKGIDTLQGKGQGKGNGSGSSTTTATRNRGTRVDPTQLPADADERLAGAAEACLPILQRTAEARGGKPVALLAVYRAIEQFARKDHVRVAGEVEHWLLHGNGARASAKDIVSRFRNFLDGSPDLMRPVPDAPGPDAYEERVREIQV